MPTTRRRTPRFAQDWITQTHIDWLYAEPYNNDQHDWFIWHYLDDDSERLRELDKLDPPERTPFLESTVTGRRLWGIFGENITEEHVQEQPGTRPERWWQFTAPEPRRRLGGVGTPTHERLAEVPQIYLGVPLSWIDDGTLETYVRIGTPLDVPALDPDDPPMYESEAAYLERLSLFLPGERKRLTSEHFEPQSILDLVDFGADEV